MYKFNGEYWYKAPAWYKRIRKWFVWIGGWEKANCKGWRFYIKDLVPIKINTQEQIAYLNSLPTLEEKQEFLKTIPHKVNRIWLTPTPISFIGHRLTIYSWGLQLSVPSGWLVISWHKRQGGHCYVSPDGTPNKAHTWYWGEPYAVKINARVSSKCR